MSSALILASGSAIRAKLLRNAGVPFEVMTAPVDEATIKASLLAEGARPRDIADTLAEMKALRVARKRDAGLVLGCDQVLDHKGALLSKPESPDHAVAQLRGLSGSPHKLLSAAVILEDGAPVWRFVGEVRMVMRDLSHAYIDDYVARNWDSIQHSVGAYRLEEEGARLFARVDGDYFTVLGLPLLQVLGFLVTRGVIDG